MVKRGNTCAVLHRNIINCAKPFSRSHDGVMRVYGEAGKVIARTIIPGISTSGKRVQPTGRNLVSL
jgi:hypothetical protein